MPPRKGRKNGTKIGYRKTRVGKFIPKKRSVYDSDLSFSDEEPGDSTASPSPTVHQRLQHNPHHSDDNIKGSIELGHHTIFSQCLKERVARMEEDYKAVQERTKQLEEDVQAAKFSAKAVVDLVEEWKRTWVSGK